MCQTSDISFAAMALNVGANGPTPGAPWKIWRLRRRGWRKSRRDLREVIHCFRCKLVLNLIPHWSAAPPPCTPIATYHSNTLLPSWATKATSSVLKAFVYTTSRWIEWKPGSGHAATALPVSPGNGKKCEPKENEENRCNRNFYRTKKQNHHPDPFGPGLGKPDALSF